MLTAAITAAITAILGLFGVKLSAWTIGAVAVGVKVCIVGVTLIFGARLMKKRITIAPPPADPDPPPPPA
jgi:amino acid transporter